MSSMSSVELNVNSRSFPSVDYLEQRVALCMTSSKNSCRRKRLDRTEGT